MLDLETQLDDMDAKATSWESKYRRAELDRQAVRLSLRRAQAMSGGGAGGGGGGESVKTRVNGAGGRVSDEYGDSLGDSLVPFGFDDEAQEDLKGWLERLMVKCLGASSQFNNGGGGGEFLEFFLNILLFIAVFAPLALVKTQ